MNFRNHELKFKRARNESNGKGTCVCVGSRHRRKSREGPVYPKKEGGCKPGKTARVEAFHSQASRENGVEIHHTVHVQTFGRNAPKANPKQVSKVYMYQSARASTAVDAVKHNRYSNQNDHNGIAVYPRRLTAKRNRSN